MNDAIKSFKIACIQSVIQPDSAYFFRALCRWYSEKFHTPLLDVYDLPFDFLLTHYYEAYYEGVSAEDRYIAIRDLLETPEEKAERLRQEEADVAVEMDTAIAKIRKMTKPKGQPVLSDAIKETDPSELTKAVTEAMASSKPTLDDQIKQLPPEFSFKEFRISEEDLDRDPLSPTPKK